MSARPFDGGTKWQVCRWEIEDRDGNGPITHAVCDEFENMVMVPYNQYKLAAFCRGHTRWYVETTTFGSDAIVGITGPFDTPEEAVTVMMLMRTEG